MTDRKTPVARDYLLADLAIKRMGLEDPRGELRSKYAQFCAFSGRRRFKLRFELTKPRGPSERLVQSQMHRSIDEETAAAEWKAHVSRPIDAGMVREVYAAVSTLLRRYATFVEAVAAETRDGDCRPGGNARTAQAAARLRRPFDAYREELKKVVGLARSVAAERGGVRVRGSVHVSALDMVLRTSINARRHWQRCVEIESRHYRRTRELSAAAELFLGSWMARGAAPAPSDLQALLEIERRLVLDRVRRRSANREIKNPAPPEGNAKTEALEPAPEPSVKTLVRAVDLRGRLESWVRANQGVVPSLSDLVSMFGGAKGTMLKAIRGSPYLRARWAERRGKLGREQQVDRIEDFPAAPLTSDGSHDETLEDLIGEQKADERREERQSRSAARRRRWDAGSGS